MGVESGMVPDLHVLLEGEYQYGWRLAVLDERQASYHWSWPLVDLLLPELFLRILSQLLRGPAVAFDERDDRSTLELQLVGCSD